VSLLQPLRGSRRRHVQLWLSSDVLCWSGDGGGRRSVAAGGKSQLGLVRRIERLYLGVPRRAVTVPCGRCQTTRRQQRERVLCVESGAENTIQSNTCMHHSLRVRSAVQRHQSIERPILCQISSLKYPKIQQRQVIMNVKQNTHIKHASTSQPPILSDMGNESWPRDCNRRKKDCLKRSHFAFEVTSLWRYTNTFITDSGTMTMSLTKAGKQCH